MAHPTGDRGFNTIHNSSVARRDRNKTLQKYTLFGVISLAALTVFLLIVLAVGAIIGNISGKPNKGPDKEKVNWGSITVTASDTQKGDLVLVNNTHAYTFPATSEHLSEIYATWYAHKPDSNNERPYVLSGLSKYMDTDALNAMDRMLQDFYNATGLTDVQVRYAYRTYEEQKQFSVEPGYSDHHTGLGVELKYRRNENTYSFITDPTYSWFFENGHKYGFVVRYPADKTDKTGVDDYEDYFRYVGIPHATYMKEHNLCMEEYIETLKSYTDNDPLKIDAADGKHYEVWYVAVDGSATVKHPTNYRYEVSGTNEGGVVVTVDRSQALRPEDSTSGETVGS